MPTSAGGINDPRLDERSNVFLCATMHGASGSFAVRIRNISTTGAMLDGEQLPPEESRVTLQRGSLCANAEVAWQSGNFRGLRFDGPIDVDAWVRHSQHAVQARVDKVILALRDGAATSVVALEEPIHPASIEELCNQLLSICERMASSHDLTIDIGEDVLKIEAIGLSIKDLSSTP